MKYQLERPPGGGRPPRLSKKKLMAAIEGSMGVIQVVADRLKASRMTVWRYLEEYPELAQMMVDEKDKLVDLAEIKNAELVSAGDKDAIKFTLTTLGKRRGYTTQQDINHQGKVEKTIQIKVIGDDNATGD